MADICHNEGCSAPWEGDCICSGIWEQKIREVEKSRDQYKAIVDRYCSRHDLKSCACEFIDDSDEPTAQCNYHLDLSKRLAQAVELLREARDDVVEASNHTYKPHAVAYYKDQIARIDAFLNAGNARMLTTDPTIEINKDKK